MSYCPTKWISPYTYTELGKAIATSAAVSATADGAAPEELRSAEEPVTDEDEYLHLNFRIHEEGRVELLPSFHLKGPAPSGEAGTPTAITCDMLGPEDRIIERWRCRLTRPDREPDAPDLVFNEHLRWHAETRAIAFRRRGELCRRYELADAPPEVTVEVRRRGDRDHIARVDWKPTDKTAPLTYLLRFSHDDGATWRAVDADLTALGLEVDLDLLPGGESCRSQVVASSGIRTAVADSDAFALAVKPVQPYILEPPPDAVFDEGAVVTLRGLGYSPDFETTPFDDVTWHSNLEGHLGVGYQLALRTLRVGRHRITLSLPDGLGDQATAGVFIDLRRAE
jgi:hypothetical protein